MAEALNVCVTHPVLGEHWMCVLVWPGRKVLPWKVVSAVVKAFLLRWAVWPSSRCCGGQIFPRDLCPWKPYWEEVIKSLQRSGSWFNFKFCVNFFQLDPIKFYKRNKSRKFGVFIISGLSSVVFCTWNTWRKRQGHCSVITRGWYLEFGKCTPLFSCVISMKLKPGAS